MNIDTSSRYRRRVVAERDALRAALGTAADHQRRVLREVLAANAGAAFGVEHGFAGIRTAADFRAAVPIRDYDPLAPWIDPAPAGASNRPSPAEPAGSFLSSGTTAARKKNPLTTDF